MAIRPNFFLIGAPKSGTSAVAKALGGHPDIFMSEPKEPYYFMYARGNPYGLAHRDTANLRTYLNLFEPGAGKKVIGEATPVYIHASYVAEEIRKLSPDAKIMAILRNPVERAVSQYRYWHLGTSVRPTPEHFRQEFFARALAIERPDGASGERRLELLESFGFYCELLTPYFECFAPDRILVMSYDDLNADPGGFLRRVLKFIDVDDSHIPPILPENVTIEVRSKALNYWLHADNGLRRLMKNLIGWSTTARACAAFIDRANMRKVVASEFLPDALYDAIMNGYRDDVAALSRLTGEDFTPWLHKKPVLLQKSAPKRHAARRMAAC